MKNELRVRKIKAFEAPDGQIFKSRRQAQKHQARLDIYKLLDTNKLYCNSEGAYVESVDLIDWLDENRDLVLAMFGVLE